MMQKDPTQRLTADDYMVQQHGKAFPDYFYTFLKTYLQRFASERIITADDKVARIHRDLDLIYEKLQVSVTEPETNEALQIIILLLTSTLRDLQSVTAKLTALDLLVKFSGHVVAEVILERVVPFLLYMARDEFAQVRAGAVRSITQCLSAIGRVPLSDANIFPEYILPEISHLVNDTDVVVRLALAETISVLSSTALRFLEVAQLHSSHHGAAADSQEGRHAAAAGSGGYEAELHTLHDTMQQLVVTLICDSHNVVKQALLEHGVSELCAVFGRHKASDVLLSHMITVLNDKSDWHLRGAFYDVIVGIAAYIGWPCATILEPLLQQVVSVVVVQRPYSWL